MENKQQLNKKSVVTFLIGALLENRLLALRYDKDDTINQIIEQARKMEEEQSYPELDGLIGFANELISDEIEHLVREFPNDSELGYEIRKRFFYTKP